MVKKTFFVGMLAIALTFGFMITACDSSTESIPSDNLQGDATGTFRTVSVKFNVKNGGSGLFYSYGIVSTPGDSWAVRDSDSYANDFTITINSVPVGTQYLNIRWKGCPFVVSNTVWAKAKMTLTSASKYTVMFDYNGGTKVATSGVYDVEVGNASNGQYYLQGDFSEVWTNAQDDKD